MTDKTVGEVVDAWTPPHRTKRYRFYIHLVDGAARYNGELEWTGLKVNEAKTLYRLTSKHADVRHFGWEETK